MKACWRGRTISSSSPATSASKSSKPRRSRIAAAFTAIAEAQGKHITGSVKVDFLCNKVQTEKTLAGLVPEGTENVVVVSCGLGVQTVADLAAVPTFTATNSLELCRPSWHGADEEDLRRLRPVLSERDGRHLSHRGLLEESCQRAVRRREKRQVQRSIPKKTALGRKIYQRLEKQGRTKEFLNQPVQLRDYSVASVDQDPGLRRRSQSQTL